MKSFVAVFSLLMPWPLRAAILRRVFGYTIHPSSRIGFSWIFPAKLILGANARIGHLTVCKGLERVEMQANSSIGRLNWITGLAASSNPRGHFDKEADRRPELLVGEHAAITNRHLLDCTNLITIGRFSTIAGFRSQFLTHSIDLIRSRQSSAPITIGEYCFVGTGVICLPGSALPDRSVLGAGSVLNKQFTDRDCLYAGVPARQVKSFDADAAYFKREQGFVR